LASCANCGSLHRHAAALQRELSALRAPAPHPSFVEQALSRATRPVAGTVWSPWRSVASLALAATVVLGLAVGVFFAMQPASTPVQTVTLTLDRPETVRVMFSSAKPLKAATLSLGLPENVELVGYGDRRELSWKTDLREGGNLLQLGLLAHGAPTDDLVARLSHGGSSKTFRLKIEVKNAGDTGM
jgi:hypothetical protein